MEKQLKFIGYYVNGGISKTPSYQSGGATYPENEPTPYEAFPTGVYEAPTQQFPTGIYQAPSEPPKQTFDSSSARDTWVFKTGLPWSEAKKLGYTDGSAKSNQKLLSELNDKRFKKENLRTSTGTKNTQTTSSQPETKKSNLFSQYIYDSILAQGDNYTNSKRFDDISSKGDSRTPNEEVEYQNALRAINDNELVKQYNNNPKNLSKEQIDRAVRVSARKNQINSGRPKKYEIEEVTVKGKVLDGNKKPGVPFSTKEKERKYYEDNGYQIKDKNVRPVWDFNKPEFTPPVMRQKYQSGGKITMSDNLRASLESALKK